MKRVLLVSCGGLGNGGVQAVMMSIVRNLRHKYQFDMLVFTSERRVYDDEFESYGGRIYRVPRYEGSNVFLKKIDYYIRGRHLYNKVLSILKSNAPYDIVHCNDEFESAVIIRAAYKMKVPTRITHTHIISKKSNILANILEKNRKHIIDKYSTVMIGCSKKACESFFKFPDKALVINNAYDGKRFDTTKISNEKFDGIRLIQIGSFNANKNQKFSLNVLKSICEVYKDSTLTFVGFDVGGYLEQLKKEVNSLGVQNNVKFLESDSDIPTLLNQSTGLLFPSINEGMGIVLIEAQSLGVKCYASDSIPNEANCGGVKYIKLKDGPDVWAKTIIDDFFATRGEHKKYDVSRFEEGNVMKYYQKIYDDSLMY